MKSSGATTILITGDVLAILLISAIGFATHRESVLTPRLLTTFLPVCAAWALQAPWLGLYRHAIFSNWRSFWRAALAMVLAAPMAALLRGLALNQSIVTVFVIALGLSAAAGMALWRLAFAIIFRRAGTNG